MSNIVKLERHVSATRRFASAYYFIAILLCSALGFAGVYFDKDVLGAIKPQAANTLSFTPVRNIEVIDGDIIRLRDSKPDCGWLGSTRPRLSVLNAM